jgi:AcrR family transcriptional regulator
LIKKHLIASRDGYAKGEQRQQSILNSAENILIKSGYENLTMRKVATDAGISVGNLQYYYPTKEALISAMLNSVIQDYLDAFDEIRHHGDPKDQFSELVNEIFLDLNTKRTSFFFPELWSLANHEKNIVVFMDEMYSKYRTVIAHLIQEINPSLNDEQAKRLSLFISASIEGHTIFVGYEKPWVNETPKISAIALQSFMWLIEHGDIPE